MRFHGLRNQLIFCDNCISEYLSHDRKHPKSVFYHKDIDKSIIAFTVLLVRLTDSEHEIHTMLIVFSFFFCKGELGGKVAEMLIVELSNISCALVLFYLLDSTNADFEFTLTTYKLIPHGKLQEKGEPSFWF